MKIFITGATGFLGYHIANICVSRGHDVLCLRRSTSMSMFEKKVEEHVLWVTEGEDDVKDVLSRFKPNVFIHAAWGGVSSSGRNNRDIQLSNIQMTDKYMRLYPYNQIIMLGSQDEYGKIKGMANEDHELNPVSEYAKAKISCCNRLQSYCIANHIEWQWIRIFSVYGEKQSSQWLIPSIIKACRQGNSTFETTKGEQCYSYLFSLDFANAIESMIGKKQVSGIYNLSSKNIISIKELQERIKNLTHSGLLFDRVLPYREHQSMIIVGDSSKFIKAFGEFEKTTLYNGLRFTINTYEG